MTGDVITPFRSLVVGTPKRKGWSSEYHPCGAEKVVGPLTVTITEYDAQMKRVAGRLSGTLHHYDGRTDKNETASLAAHFRATSL